MQSNTVSKPPLSVCVSVYGCFKPNTAVFPSAWNVSSISMPEHCVSATTTAASLTVLSNIFLCPLSQVQSVSSGAEEEAEQVLNYLKWKSLERRKGKQVWKKKSFHQLWKRWEAHPKYRHSVPDMVRGREGDNWSCKSSRWRIKSKVSPWDERSVWGCRERIRVEEQVRWQ